jgi:hypothetical protein
MTIEVIEDLLCEDAINEICRAGKNDQAVRKWTMFYLHELGQLNICPFACKTMLKDYDFGAVSNNIEWIERAIWIASWNVFER